MLKNLKPLLLFVLGIVLINILGNFFFYRFDLTSAQQYTLSNNTKNIISDVTEPVAIRVFLRGDFPGEFKRLQLETQYLLEEFAALNKNVKFEFINPLNQEEDAQQVAQRFYQAGMTPESLNIRENGKLTERLMFPWAVAELNDKQVKIPLLKKNITSNNEEIVNLSIANLEYNFASALNQLVYEKTKKIAVMRGNGELADLHIADFANSLKEFYYIAPFTLDSTAVNPIKTLKQLEGFDLVIEAKPSMAFTEKEKFVLDQYLMQGGKMLWLTEGVIIEKDSLFSNPENTALAMPKNLNLQDYFFSYGIRINPSLVQDLVSAPLILAQGEGNNTQFKPIPWFYSPLAISTNNHPIIKNIEAVKLEFSSPIDTLERKGLKKTILLHSSPKTKLEQVPSLLNLQELLNQTEAKGFNQGTKNIGVLIEGKFKSVYDKRIKPVDYKDYRESSDSTQMVVIADGDIVKNEFGKNGPIELGFDRFTGTTYGNKSLLINAVNYMLDDKGLLALRSKDVKLAFLNTEKVAQERLTWQLLNLGLPLLILTIAAAIYYNLRKRKYAR